MTRTHAGGQLEGGWKTPKLSQVLLQISTKRNVQIMKPFSGE